MKKIKINKKIFFVVFLIIIIVFISSCKGGTTRTSDVEVHKGSEGLVITFYENAPPKETFEDSSFMVNIKAENKGVYDIKDSYLLLNYEEAYMDIEGEPSKAVNIKGKTMINPYGDWKTFNYKLKTKKIGNQEETHTSLIIGNACYIYQTSATPNVCIDPDIYNEKTFARACKTADIKLNDQGAPVAIKKIEVKMLPHESDELIRPQFLIYLSNVGNGEVIDKDKAKEMCSSTSVSHSTWNAAAVDVYITMNGLEMQLDCKPKKNENSENQDSKTGYLKFQEKEDYVRCTLEEGIEKSNPAETTPLLIKVNYGYTTTISKEVLIKREDIH